MVRLTHNVQYSQCTTGNLVRIFQVSFILFLFYNIFGGIFNASVAIEMYSFRKIISWIVWIALSSLIFILTWKIWKQISAK